MNKNTLRYLGNIDCGISSLYYNLENIKWNESWLECEVERYAEYRLFAIFHSKNIFGKLVYFVRSKEKL